MRFLLRLSTLALMATGTGCLTGPDYQRPAVAAPQAFRFGSSSSTRVSFGDLDWRSVFRDPALRGLITESLAASPDLKAASARVLEAQAGLTMVRAQMFPAAGADYTGETGHRVNKDFPALSGDIESHGAALNLARYEIDFWGRLRRATEAAQAQLLGSEEARRIVQQGLVAGIATAYLSLREQDLELEIATRTLKSREDFRALVNARELQGESSRKDLLQADTLVAEAEAASRTVERQIALLENQISVLCARPPGPIARGRPLEAQALLVTAPPGLPAGLLARRPDVRLAEQNLVAANARTGVAQAALLPSVTLTGAAGVSSREFSALLTNPSRFWSLGPAVSVPVFAGGSLRAAVRGSQAAREAAAEQFRGTVLEALREVSDALISGVKNRAVREARGRIVSARREALGLMEQAYANGQGSYMEVLYTDQQLFSTELDLARARFSELSAVVSLYRALGGGWDPSSVPPPVTAAR